MTGCETNLSPNVEPLPDRMKRLRIDPIRKIPVPWFVAWIGGKPEFRVANGEKLTRAISERLCWVCGGYLPRGREMAYIVGPMCGVNRTTAEPPCHIECARYSARNCPFLARPAMERRESGLPTEADGADCAGFMIKRNPGCCLLWVTKQSPKLFGDHRGGLLFRLPEPNRIEAFAEGHPTGAERVMESVEAGYPILHDMAAQEGEAAVRELDKYLKLFITTMATRMTGDNPQEAAT